MKNVYPVVLTPADEGGYVVYMPDFDINTQGNDFVEAIEMARDAISLMGVTLEDQGKTIPEPSSVNQVERASGDIVTLVDVDFSDYRRKTETRAVKKNCTIPAWLCYAAEKANINFSEVLQNALKRELGVESH